MRTKNEGLCLLVDIESKYPDTYISYDMEEGFVLVMEHHVDDDKAEAEEEYEKQAGRDLIELLAGQ